MHGKIDSSSRCCYYVKMRSNCPISCALDVVGDQWSLIVLRDVVLLKRRRFSEIAQNEGIATNILSDRLTKLEAAGLVKRVTNEKDRRGKLVEPTEKALDLIPMMMDLLVFGVDHCGGRIDDDLVNRVRNEREVLIDELRGEARSTYS